MSTRNSLAKQSRQVWLALLMGLGVVQAFVSIRVDALVMIHAITYCRRKNHWPSCQRQSQASRWPQVIRQKLFWRTKQVPARLAWQEW